VGPAPCRAHGAVRRSLTEGRRPRAQADSDTDWRAGLQPEQRLSATAWRPPTRVWSWGRISRPSKSNGDPPHLVRFPGQSTYPNRVFISI